MKYRTNKKNGEEISLLGYGAMRLPLNDDGSINENEAIREIRYAIDNGVNYVDTAYPYHGGMSEVVVGKALKDGYRERTAIATKLPLFLMKKAEDMQTLFDTQLSRLDASYIDYYLVHDINDESYNKVKEFKVLDFMKKKKDEGKIKSIGFSFHGSSPEFFKKVVDMADWDFLQIQLNFMDTEYQAGVEGLKYAGEKGIPVVIMEPLRGGKLCNVIPGSIQEYWDSMDIKRSPVEWALRWVANFPEVMTILSGMSNMDQVIDNIRILSDAEANSLTDKELKTIEKIAEEYRQRVPYGCTGCKYCMPCPQGLDIPTIIELRNDVTIYDAEDEVGVFVKGILEPKPAACIACGECEEKCPQDLNIVHAMTEMEEMFA